MRTYLLASEKAVHEAGLHTQQHQLLLAVAGAPPNVRPTIGYAADLLGLKHNSAVELVDRCENERLLRRVTDEADRRRVCLEITSRGQEVLDRLSQFHLQELFSLGPHLIEALQTVLHNEASPGVLLPEAQRSAGPECKNSQRSESRKAVRPATSRTADRMAANRR
jgi:DNA-binding MarR family transcriptional regulator